MTASAGRRPRRAPRRARPHRVLAVALAVLAGAVSLSVCPAPTAAAQDQDPTSVAEAVEVAEAPPGAVPDGTEPAVGTAPLAEEDEDGPQLVLVRQDAWIGTRGRFTLEVGVDTPEAGYTIEARLLRAVDTVPEVLAGDDAVAAGISIGRIRFPDPDEPAAGDVLSSLELEIGPSTQTVGVSVVPDADGTGGNPFVLDPGVFPILVQLFDPNGNEVDQLVTHLIHLSAELSDTPAPIGVIVDERLPARRDAAGRAELDEDEVRRLGDELDALGAHRSLPLALQVQPETIAALTDNRATPSGAALTDLDRLVANSAAGSLEILPSTFVAFDEAGWLADNASDVLRSELDAGVATLDANALRRPDGAVSLDHPGDPALLARLFDFGFEHVVQPADADADAEEGDAVRFGAGPHLVVELPRQRVLPTPQHRLAPAEGAALGPADAHRLLAAVLIGPLGGDRSAQQIRLGTSIANGDAFATTLLGALDRAGGPLRPVSIDELFSDEDHLAAPATWNVETPARAGATEGRALRLAGTVARIAGLHSMVGDPVLLASLEARLLLLPSGELDDATIDGLFDGIEAAVQAGRRAVVLPPAQSFTVTSHRTSLPLVLRNEGARPVQVLLSFRSGELEFTGDNPRLVTLQPGVNDLDIPIRTRRSGELEFSIDVTSPDSNLSLGEIDVRVLSRAISGVGVLLSGGALVFLVVWWIRNARRRRALARAKAGADRTATAATDTAAPTALPNAAEAAATATDGEPGDGTPEPAGRDAAGEATANGRRTPSSGPPGRR